MISSYNSLFLVALGDDDATPDWKIFNITGWNGTDNIFLDRIFPKAGDLNKYDFVKVKIFDGNAPQGPNNSVPDSGSTALLLGSALLALALYPRRKSAQGFREILPASLSLHGFAPCSFGRGLPETPPSPSNRRPPA